MPSLPNHTVIEQYENNPDKLSMLSLVNSEISNSFLHQKGNGLTMTAEEIGVKAELFSLLKKKKNYLYCNKSSSKGNTTNLFRQ